MFNKHITQVRLLKFFGVFGVVLVFLFAGIAGTFLYRSHKTTAMAVQQWNAYQKNAQTKSMLLANLIEEIGYGGMIHNFKNLIIRHTPEYEKKLQRNFWAIEDLLATYMAFCDTEKEIIALRQVSETLSTYQRAQYKFAALKKEGKTVEEIDTILKIDDSKALKALHNLQQFFLEDSVKQQEKFFFFSFEGKKMTRQAGQVVALLILLGILLSWLFWRLLKEIMLREEREQQLQDSECQYRDIAEGSAQGLLVHDASGSPLFINRALKKIIYTPGAPEEPDRRRIVATFYRDHLTRQLLKQLKRGERKQFSKRIEANRYGDKDKIIHIEITVRRIFFEGHKAYQVMVLDVTDQVFYEEELKSQAYTDPLTGAFNRRFADEAFAREHRLLQRHKVPCSILLMDLDFFKSINDTYGHDLGDETLRQFVSIIRDISRIDDILARLGGEEFLLLLPHTKLEDALKQAERIRKAFGTTEIIGKDASFFCSVSIGAADIFETDLSFDSACKRADLALYKAKQEGRNCVRY